MSACGSIFFLVVRAVRTSTARPRTAPHRRAPRANPPWRSARRRAQNTRFLGMAGWGGHRQRGAGGRHRRHRHHHHKRYRFCFYPFFRPHFRRANLNLKFQVELQVHWHNNDVGDNTPRYTARNRASPYPMSSTTPRLAGFMHTRPALRALGNGNCNIADAAPATGRKAAVGGAKRSREPEGLAAQPRCVSPTPPPPPLRARTAI